MKTVLMIDDDYELGVMLQDYMQDFDIDLVSAITPDDGLKKLASLQPDLVILDLMLPDVDGFSLCRKIREGGSVNGAVPIIMLTARGDPYDRVVGLEVGADDYVTKPFDARELVARIKASLRREVMKTEGRAVEAGPLKMDVNSGVIYYNDKEIRLTTMEFEALRIFMENPGKVLTRDDLLNRELLSNLVYDHQAAFLPD